jgi:hypothetical protein
VVFWARSIPSLDAGAEEGFFAIEVEVEGALGDAESIGEAPHIALGIAGLGEEFGGGGDDRFAAGGAAAGGFLGDGFLSHSFGRWRLCASGAGGLRAMGPGAEAICSGGLRSGRSEGGRFGGHGIPGVIPGRIVEADKPLVIIISVDSD